MSRINLRDKVLVELLKQYKMQCKMFCKIDNNALVKIIDVPKCSVKLRDNIIFSTKNILLYDKNIIAVRKYFKSKFA